MWKKFLHKEENFGQKDLQSLEAALSKISQDDVLSESKKSLMKDDIFHLIDNGGRNVVYYEQLANKVKGIGKERVLSNYQKNLLYREVLQKIRLRKKNIFPWLWIFRSWKASLASLLVFVLVLGSFVIAPFELRVTRASKWTFLESVEGEVFVNRNGKIMSVNKDFSLQEGDLVFTGKESFVTIRYLDDSVTRLGENTSLELARLYVRPDNAVQTKVQLILLGGQLWASVYNLIDGESEFVVETENTMANVSSRAAFELKSFADHTTVTVFENVVDVRKKSAKVESVQPVVAGFKAEINTKPFKIAQDNTGIVVEKNSNQVDGWVVTNLALDKKHAEKLKEENLEFISSAVVKDVTLGAIADFKDTTKSIFTNTDIEKARQRFLEVHLGFMKAQDYLDKAESHNDLRRKATPLLIQYKTAIKEITASYEELKKADNDQADRLLARMKEELDLQKKALSLVLPGEKLYTAKEVVLEARSYFARNSAEKARYMLDWSKNRLMETQSLIAKNDLKGAEAAFRSYLKGLDALVSEVEKSQVAEIEGSLFALLEEQIKQFKTLTAIESELLGKNDQRLSGMVAAVKEDSLKKLVSVVKYYRKNQIPFRMVNELKNIAQDYFQGSSFQKIALGDLEQILSDYPEYQDMLETNKVDVGSLEVIVDFEATKDLEMKNLDCLQCAEEQSKND